MLPGGAGCALGTWTILAEASLAADAGPFAAVRVVIVQICESGGDAAWSVLGLGGGKLHWSVSVR